LQVHGQNADAATAGQRTAVNLAGASTEDLLRGMTLARPGTFEATRRADVRLQLLSSAPHPLKNRARVHFHSYTMETVAEAVLHGIKQIPPGGEAFVRVKLPKAALLLPGDRFIIRQFSPVVTIGGGIVLDAAPILRRPVQRDLLQALAGANPEPILEARIARRQQEGISLSRLVAETGWTRGRIESLLSGPVKQGRVVRIADVFLESSAVDELKRLIVSRVGDFHRKNPLVGGISKEELRVQTKTTPEVFDAVVAMLVHEKKIEITGDLVRWPGLGVVMKDEEAAAKKQIEETFAQAGLKVPALQEVIAGLKVDKVRAQKIVTLLLRDKALIRVSDELVFHRSALDELRRHVAAYRVKSLKIDVAQFKELTGVTRKYAIPLLEYLDRERVTKRVGDAREIL
jgi:selenocysteine-specific elongation factor